MSAHLHERTISSVMGKFNWGLNLEDLIWVTSTTHLVIERNHCHHGWVAGA